MKYCPNPSCSFLAEMKQVAEYEDFVTHCKDCDAELVAEAPDAEVLLRENQKQALGLELVAEFASLEDAEAYRQRMELAGIPAVVEGVESESADEEIDAEEIASEAVEEGELPVWQARLFVRKGDLAAAFRVIDLIDEETDGDIEEDEEEVAEVTNPAIPGSFESNYPNLAEWITTGGQITIGRDYDSSDSVMVRITDPGGTVWESDEDFATLHALFSAAEQGLQEWIEENG